MIVEYHKVDIETPISTCDYFRNLTVNNLTDEAMWIRILINVEYTKVNCLLPHLISGNVLAHKSETIPFFRLDPTK